MNHLTGTWCTGARTSQTWCAPRKLISRSENRIIAKWTSIYFWLQLFISMSCPHLLGGKCCNDMSEVSIPLPVWSEVEKIHFVRIKLLSSYLSHHSSGGRLQPRDTGNNMNLKGRRSSSFIGDEYHYLTEIAMITISL